MVIPRPRASVRDKARCLRRPAAGRLFRSWRRFGPPNRRAAKSGENPSKVAKHQNSDPLKPLAVFARNIRPIVDADRAPIPQYPDLSMDVRDPCQASRCSDRVRVAAAPRVKLHVAPIASASRRRRAHPA